MLPIYSFHFIHPNLKKEIQDPFLFFLHKSSPNSLKFLRDWHKTRLGIENSALLNVLFFL